MASMLARLKPTEKWLEHLDDVCREVADKDEEAEEKEGFLHPLTIMRITESVLKAAQAKHPELAKATPLQVRSRIAYLVDQKIEQRKADNPSRFLPPATAENFWRAASTYNPRNSNKDPGNLCNLLLVGAFKAPVPVGKLFGKYDLVLIPRMGALPTQLPPASALTDTDGYAPDVGGGAIIYADGHPSEDDMVNKVTPKEPRLRTYVSLGWLVMRKEKKEPWKEIGHVLVMDLDEGENHQPWIVLAKRWPMDDDEAMAYPDEPDVHHVAPTEVGRDSFWEKGVFPGHKNRTPIAKLVPMSSNIDNRKPLLLYFNEKLDIDLERKTGPRLYVRNNDMGPDLAYPTEWYALKNSKDREIVCYTHKGLEYMRFNPRTKLYSFPGFRPANHLQDVGYDGNLVDLDTLSKEVLDRYMTRTKKVSLEQRLQNMSVQDKQADRRYRDQAARSSADEQQWTSSNTLRASAALASW